MSSYNKLSDTIAVKDADGKTHRIPLAKDELRAISAEKMNGINLLIHRCFKIGEIDFIRDSQGLFWFMDTRTNFQFIRKSD